MEINLNILLSLKSTLYFEGLNRLLAEDDQAGVKFRIYSLATLENLTPHIIVTDGRSMDRDLFVRYPTAKRVIIDNGLADDEIAAITACCKVDGFIAPDTSVKLFKKALTVVCQGEVWLNNRMVKSLLNHRGGEKKQSGLVLSPREREVIDHVCSGCSNKEIASKLLLSEQTVKVHLNRIYRKFNVANRSQLIVVAMKNSGIVSHEPPCND